MSNLTCIWIFIVYSRILLQEYSTDGMPSVPTTTVVRRSSSQPNHRGLLELGLLSGHRKYRPFFRGYRDIQPTCLDISAC